MNDPEVLFTVGWTGAGFGAFAAVLYIFTSGREAAGFRLFPMNADEWVGYWFRTLELTLCGCILLSYGRIITELICIVFVGAFFLLLASCVVFWRSDRILAVSGICFLILAVLAVLGYPAGSAVRER